MKINLHKRPNASVAAMSSTKSRSLCSTPIRSFCSGSGNKHSRCVWRRSWHNCMNTHTRRSGYTTVLCVCVCVYAYMYVCVCVCVCACDSPISLRGAEKVSRDVRFQKKTGKPPYTLYILHTRTHTHRHINTPAFNKAPLLHYMHTHAHTGKQIRTHLQL